MSSKRLSAITFGLSVLALASASAIIPRDDLAGKKGGPLGLDNAHCQHHFYSIDASSTNIKFTGIDQTNQSQSSVTALIAEYSTSKNNFTRDHMDGTFEFSGQFNISGTLCTPIMGGKEDGAIQLLVHGVGFDSTYWDFSLAPEYSYIKQAASHGYTTFRYDRIGTGLSETPENGFDVVQTATEVSILTNISKMLQSTTRVGGKVWPKLVAIGHSYGSVLTQAVSSATPELYNAIILQGFTANTTTGTDITQAAAFALARDVLPGHLGDKPSTWLATGTLGSNQLIFWDYPHYSADAFALARGTEQPVTLGSLFTTGMLTKPALGFSKPVLVVVGDKDILFTGGNAYAGKDGKTIPEDVRDALYPNSVGFETYIPAHTGHVVNQHYSAPETYDAMIKFVARNNL